MLTKDCPKCAGPTDQQISQQKKVTKILVAD